MDAGIGRTAGAAVGGIGGQGSREMAELAGEVKFLLLSAAVFRPDFPPCRAFSLTGNAIARKSFRTLCPE